MTLRSALAALLTAATLTLAAPAAPSWACRPVPGSGATCAVGIDPADAWPTRRELVHMSRADRREALAMMRTKMRPCDNRSDRACKWLAWRQGDDTGRSWIAYRGRMFYLNGDVR